MKLAKYDVPTSVGLTNYYNGPEGTVFTKIDQACDSEGVGPYPDRFAGNGKGLPRDPYESEAQNPPFLWGESSNHSNEIQRCLPGKFQ